MKFRARITELSGIRYFACVLSTLSRLGKSFCLRITPDNLYFILSDGNFVVWCNINQTHMFEEFKMEGVTAEHNEIYIGLEPDKISRNLNSLKTQPEVTALKIKLTHKHSPCLTVEIEMPTANGKRVVLHDIPVEVISRKRWPDYQKPVAPSFQRSLYLPSLKLVRNMVEQMRNFANTVTVQSDDERELTFLVKTDTVTVATHYNNVTAPDWDDPDIEAQAESGHISVVVDVKKLFQFFQVEQLNPERVILNIVKNKTLQLIAVHEDVTLEYFLPGIST